MGMRILCMLLVAILLTSHAPSNHAHEDHAYDHHHDEIHWDAEKIASANISIQTAEKGFIRNVFRAPGQIVIHPNHIAFVLPKVGGSVKTIKKEQGDFVKEGEILAVVESKEIAEAKAAYLAALKKRKLKKMIFQREKTLRQISPEQDYLLAKSNFEEAAIEEELAKQKLLSLGMDEAEIAQLPYLNNQTLRMYEIRAPFDGEIIQRDLTKGELIDDKRKAFTIADFGQVRVEFNINPSLLPFIKQGQAVEIVSSDGIKAMTTISYVEPTIHEGTRNAIAVANLDNQARQWAPGTFISAIIQEDEQLAPIVVPKESIQRIKGKEVIFTYEQGIFSPKEVKTGKADDKNVEIISGLHQGERYVASNAFLLKADFEKAEAEHSHTH